MPTAVPNRVLPPLVRDVALVGIVAGLSLALLAHGGLGIPSPQAHSLDLFRILLGVATAAPLIAWRRTPLGAFVVIGVASAILGARGEAVWPPVGLIAAIYLLVRARPNATSWTPANLTVVLMVLGTYIAFGLSDVGEVLHTAVALAAAWLAGEVGRLRRAQIAELHDRAVRAEREATRERDLAVAQERTRIARDLHDSVAHALNVIGIRAGTARLRNDPDKALAALTSIEELSRATMTDIDEVIGTLRAARSGDEPVETPPGLAALDTLIAEHRDGGHDVSLTLDGTPGVVSMPVEHSAYRIVQEALTNAARYGTGTSRVEVTYTSNEIQLRVVNRVPPDTPDAVGGGHGLVGMRERAEAVGGELEVEPTGVEFRISARLPTESRRR